MQKTKRIFALLGVVLIAALYLITLVLSFSSHPNADRWLMASLFATIAVPLFLYIMLWLSRVLNKNDEE